MDTMEDREASYYERLEGGAVRCLLCPNLCRIVDGKRGRCSQRENRSGRLVALSYGRTVTLNVDPIEKKPLYHFMPGSRILSIGPNGCTLTCDSCQNWGISQEPAPTRFIPPEELVELAAKEGSIGVAFTYTEPLLWFEYLKDAAPALREHGLKSVLVTNGYLNEEPAAEIVPLIDAFNVDLKSMEDDFYRKWCGGTGAGPVRRFIEIAAGVTHVEVTNLLIPGLNDSPENIGALVDWLAGVSDEIPLHFSRFFPQYRMNDRPPTPRQSLEKAYEIAKQRLKHVYIGNIAIGGTENTYCPSCGAEAIRRERYRAEVIGTAGQCPKCRTGLKGVWE